jgi:hypothetical protein
MLPHAEISTAGVIMAVSTVMAEDKGFIAAFCFEGAFIEINLAEGNVRAAYQIEVKTSSAQL